MKYRPILFTTDMVRAILDGRKTQTRRIKYKCDVGDILWVRETWNKAVDFRKDEAVWGYVYKADNPYDKGIIKWKPSIFMPREACRLFLQVESVRVEQLHKITHEECYKEGIIIDKAIIADEFYLFQKLWDSINAKRGYGWDSNPMVKVIEFRRHDG